MKTKELILASFCLSFVLYFVKHKPSTNDYNPSSFLKAKKEQLLLNAQRKTKEQVKRRPASRVLASNARLKFQNKAGISKIKSLKACIKFQNCKFPNTDPRSYDLAVYKKISVLISKNKEIWKKEWPSLSQNTQYDISQLFKLPDGHVKKELLAFVKTLPSQEAQNFVPEILDSIVDYHDSSLIPDTLDFLSKNMSKANQEEIASRVASSIQSGSPHVAEALSENIYKVLNKTTAPFYKNMLNRLPASSSEKTVLNAALKEFEMQTTGG